MQDIRLEIDGLAQLECCLAHQCESEEVVAVGCEACVSVDSLSVVEHGVAHEVVDGLFDLLHADLDLLGSVQHGNVELADQLSRVLEFRVVCGNDDSGIMAFIDQCGRKSSYNIGEST